MEERPLVFTDTDIFGYRIDLPKDKYQLIYGIFKYAVKGGDYVEECLYNLVATLCNEYQAPLLRERKIQGWIELIDYIERWCASNGKKGDCRFLVPFIATPDFCSLRDLQECLVFVKETLLSAEKSFTPTYDLYPCKFFQYPIPPIKDMLVELYNEHISQVDYDLLKEEPIKDEDGYSFEEALKLYPKWCYAVANGVLWEMENRDIYLPEIPTGGELDPEYENMYDTYLLHRTPDDKEYKPENVEEAKELTIKQRVGVIKFMLECFGVKEPEQVRKLAHFVVKDKEEYTEKTNSNDTIYSILHNDKQIYKLTPYFKKTLKRYGLTIPDGLKELDKRMFD